LKKFCSSGYLLGTEFSFALTAFLLFV